MSKDSAYNETQVRQWLRWLASNMQANNQTVFLLEDLQPSWLRGPGEDRKVGGVFSQSNLYLLFSSSIYALPIAIALLEPFWRSGDVMSGLPWGFWMIAVAAVGRSLSIASQLNKYAVIALIAAFEFGWYPFSSESNSVYVFAAVATFPLVGISRNGRSKSDLIQPVELMEFSLKSGWKKFCSVCSWLTFFPPWMFWHTVAGLKGAIQPKKVVMKVGPNRGIWLSLRNSLLLFIPIFIIGAVLFVAPLLGYHGILILLFDSFALPLLGIAISLGSHFGGMDFIDHFALRLMMRLFGYAPWDYVRFLDYAATELGFLQKVGGGYIFMDRYLLEYFATMSDEEVAAPAESMAVMEG